MKTLYLLFEHPLNHIIGAYPDIETLEFELLVIAGKKYNIKNVYAKTEENVPEETYNKLIEAYKRREVWN